MKPDLSESIFSTGYIRTSADKMASHCLSGGTHFELHEARLAAAAEFVIDVIRSRYSDLNVPYHSRWRHFEVGDQVQLKAYHQATADKDPTEKARIGLDLILPSVLVDAGAGDKWRYESANSEVVGRSEGLGLASLDAFLSSDYASSNDLVTHSDGLKKVTHTTFCERFKVTETNPMLGVEGRVGLLNSLAKTLDNKPQFFPNRRPGDLVDYILNHYGHTVSAEQVLKLIIESLGDIWPGRIEHDGINLGDTWSYSKFGEGADGYVPFHKLSQWISYSVIETLENNGFVVSGLDRLTGLAEYRNGGLMLDFGLLSLRDASIAEQSWQPASEVIVEWRALTIYLLDKLGALIQDKLDLTAAEFPLAKVLEGGTWAAGRKLAAEKRTDAAPPISIVSDGTVF